MQNHAVDPFGIVGQVLDAQFRVDRLVGEGGFSAVYRGHHVGLDEPIAVKCLKLPPAMSPPLVDQFEKRFRDESRILYRLSQGNLNIVRSIAAGTWQAPAGLVGLVVPYMVLEWMEGRSLANEFAIRRSVGKQGRSLEEIVQLFESAADGLGHAHAQGVVHRDLNPGNLFLASSPQGTRMKVLDFGVAKILDESTLDIARMQTVGQIRIFAPAYGAPEQFDDSIGKVGPASDVYSFALILLEALRDRCVSEGQNLGEFALKAIDPNRRPTPRMLGIDVPDEVEQIFARATKLDPRERWQNAGELWRALALAVSSASRQKHAQAAMETPPLAMPQPQGIRSTQKGMAPPPEPAKAPGVRMNKTMPLGAAMPKLDVPRPGAAAPPSTGQSAPKIPAAPSAPTSAPRVPTQPSAAQAATGGPGQPATQRFTGEGVPSLAEEEDEDARTHVGAMSGKAPLGEGQPEEQEEEQEDEVTRVRAPEPDILRGLADLEAQKLPGKARLATTQLSSGSSPRPAAGAPAAGAPPLQDPASAAGGTFMMAPGPFGEAAPLPSTQPPPPAAPPHAQPEAFRPSSGQLGQTLPLTGPHPLGLPGQASTNGPIPAAGAPPAPYGSVSPDGPSTFGDAGQHGWSPSNPGPQPSQPSQQLQQQFQQPLAPYPAYPHAHAPQQQHPMMQPSPHIMVPSHGQNMPFGQQPHDPRMSESVSLPPGSISGVPKKSNTVLFIALGLGALALVGIGLAAAVVLGGKGNGAGPVASVSAPPASSPIASAPPPPPAPPPTAPPVIDPTPAADVVPDASDAVTANGGDDVDAGSTATSTATTTTAAPAPAPTPAPAPVPVPMPTPVVVKDAGPPPDPHAFNEAAARSRLAQANGVLVFCKKEGGVTGPGTAHVTFGPEGAVTAVSLDPPYAGTPAGDCVTGHFKRTKVSSFEGSPRTIKHSFDVPK